MSDEHEEQGRDESAPAGDSPQQRSVPAYLGGPTPQASQAAPSQSGPSRSGPSQSAPDQASPSRTTPNQASPLQTPPSQAAPQQPYGQQPYASQPYAQQPYSQQPYAPQPHQPGPAWATAGAPWGAPQATAQHAGAQHPTAQHPTAQHPTAQHGTAQPAGAQQAGAQPPPIGHGGGTALLERPRAGKGRTGIVVMALVAGLVGGGAAGAGTVALLDRSAGGGTVLSQSPSSTNASNATPGTVAAAAAKAMPSTVDIQVALRGGTSEGTGVILTADGNILTNNHVVAGNTGTISVTLADGSEHAATVVGTSPSYDLAVIKVQGVSGLTPAALGISSDLQVGQQVVAIGSPQGLTGTVTDGIVSAFNRTVSVQGEDGNTVVYNGLQTDAAINPGNSGGPLVNLDGQVVGINSAILSSGSTNGSEGGSIGLGFSIPIDQAKRVAEEIMKSGSATKPVLGVTGSVTGAQGTGSGAQINQVQAGSPAATAGLKSGDVVTKVGDAKVEDFADLIARIGSYAPGAKVTLTIGTGAGARTADVTLGSQADKAASTGTGGESTNPFGGGN